MTGPARHELHLRLGRHAWTIRHSGAILSADDERRFLTEETARMPYGVALWPASIALAHELAARADTLAGLRVLELGGGTGLPGIVAATFGASVVQTDRQERALALGRENAERNGAAAIEHRLADWTLWEDTERYDLILGADILYATRLQPFVRAILEHNLAPTGHALLADPFRPESLALLEAMEHDGWSVALGTWAVDGRSVGVYDCRRP